MLVLENVFVTGNKHLTTTTTNKLVYSRFNTTGRVKRLQSNQPFWIFMWFSGGK